MSRDKVVRFPIKGYERWKNRLGPRAVPCHVTLRWLQFPEQSDHLKDGHYMFVDVMTRGSDDTDKKICQLCISKEDILAALGAVDAKPKS